MTRIQKIEKLARQYRNQRMNHKAATPVWQRLRDTVTRDLIAYVKERKREVKHGMA